MIEVRPLLHARIAGSEAERESTALHASDMADREFCPREFALMDATKKGRPWAFVSTAMRVTWDYGDFLQWSVNNIYLRDIMWGRWKCLSCGRQTGPLPCKVPTKPCKMALKTRARCRWEYRELVVECEPMNAVCSLDCLLKDGPKLRLAEIKTEVKDSFRDLQAPRAVHRLRTQLYLRMIDSTMYRKLVHTDGARLLYICKGYGVKDEILHARLKEKGISDWPYTPFKEYRIERNDGETDHLVSRAVALRAAREEKAVPCGICPTAMCKRARECPVAKECFSGKFPGTVTWVEKGKPFHKGKKIGE